MRAGHHMNIRMAYSMHNLLHVLPCGRQSTCKAVALYACKRDNLPSKLSFVCVCGISIAQICAQSLSGTLQVLTNGHMQGFMILAMLWAAVNAIPPILFLVYFTTKGWLLRWSCTIGQILGLLFGAGELVDWWQLLFNMCKCDVFFCFAFSDPRYCYPAHAGIAQHMCTTIDISVGRSCTPQSTMWRGCYALSACHVLTGCHCCLLQLPSHACGCSSHMRLIPGRCCQVY